VNAGETAHEYIEPVVTTDGITDDTAPSSAGATGAVGDVRYDSDHIYLCVATDTWKRTPLNTW